MESAETVRIGHQVVRVPPGGRVVLDPPSPIPALTRLDKPRWNLSAGAIGIIERLARTRYEVARLMPEEETLWGSAADPSGAPIPAPSNSPATEREIVDPIAQSVWASTQIEGESVYVEDLNLAIVGQPPRKGASPEYLERARSTRAIYEAYLWALSEPFPLAGNQTVTREFITELHKRMFASTKPDQAGKLKDKQNRVQWGGHVELVVLPPNRVAEFLDRACDRVNSAFVVADTTARYSKLIAVAEFLVDFLAIHPFADGNGRTARLLSTYLLERAGFHFARFYSLDVIILERQQLYYKALFESQKHWLLDTENVGPWVEFYLDAILTQWLRAHEKMVVEARNRS